MKYTWVPDRPDFRDYKFIAETSQLPIKVDLRSRYGLVYDQLQIGSCTSNSLAMAYDFERIKQGLQPMQPSRLFIYYNERAMEGTIMSDSGAMIRDGIKVMASIGVCSEKAWNYNPKSLFVKPLAKAYGEAKHYCIKQYLRLDNTKINDLKSCLAAGYPFVFGFSVFESFESNYVAQTGDVEMPNYNEQNLGGHAVCCVGYDDSKEKFIVRNSWGSNWADGGHFYIPYQYLTNTNLADDFWTIRLV